jgi:ParB family transcriptional regulator, chromosome partitioning protein
MNIQMIALNQLVVSPANVRKTGTKIRIEELAANIAAIGLLQNLQVRPTNSGTYEVVAGSRRMAALKLLAKQKALAKDEPVTCNVLGSGEDPVEVSLAENEMREAMHPADQFAAFKQRIDAGQPVEDVAARFGVTPLVVRQRLKLACVSPKLMKLYKDGAMNLEQLMAFTVSDDHAAQESAWAELAEWNRRPQAIRAHLTKAHVDADDRRVRFVTLEAYRQAGGQIITDLFESDTYVADVALLDRLCAEKLETEAQAVRGEGWKWVEIMPEASYEAMSGYGRQSGKREPLPAKKQTALEKLQQQRDALAEQDEYSDEDAAQIDALDTQIAALEDASLTWSDRQKKRCGAVVSLGHEGRVEITRGLVAPADVKAAKADDGDSGVEAEAQVEKETPGLSAKLVEELTAHHTMALRAVLTDQPVTALIAAVHALAVPMFYDGLADTALDLRATSAWLKAEGIDDSPAAKQLAERHQAWRTQLPEQIEGLWDWLIRQDMQTLIGLLAYCVAATVKPERTDAFNALAGAVGLDMTQWWQPTAVNYLGRVSKALILEAVTECVSPNAAANLASLKKGDMATNAEERLAGKGWLPAVLRR